MWRREEGGAEAEGGIGISGVDGGDDGVVDRSPCSEICRSTEKEIRSRWSCCLRFVVTLLSSSSIDNKKLVYSSVLTASMHFLYHEDRPRPFRASVTSARQRP